MRVSDTRTHKHTAVVPSPTNRVSIFTASPSSFTVAPDLRSDDSSCSAESPECPGASSCSAESPECPEPEDFVDMGDL